MLVENEKSSQNLSARTCKSLVLKGEKESTKVNNDHNGAKKTRRMSCPRSEVRKSDQPLTRAAHTLS